jgi:hypothetical protein
MQKSRIASHLRATCSGLLLVVLAATAAQSASADVFYRFDEPAWTGAAGEVLDGGGNGLDAIAVGGASNDDAQAAIASDPGTCRYGVFDGANDYVEIADDSALDLPTELTVAAWINMRSVPAELHTIVSKDTNYEFHVNGSRRVYWWWNDSVGATRSITTGTSISLDQWHHVAITYQSGSQTIYIDGVSRATSSFTGTLAQNDLPAYIGTDWNFISRAFDGFIDEVYILPRALSAAEVQALRAETHDCATAAQFTINHDGFGINCAAETIVVNVVDSNAGTPLLSYNAQVRLDTQTGSGTWSISSGAGSFSDGTADDGVASYTWPLGESQAVFSLSYPQGQSPLDVDVYQISDPGIRDTDAEGSLTFSPNGFVLTAAALTNPPAPAVVPFAAAQTAAVDFPLHIAAYGQTPDDPVCGIIEGYTGTKALKFWSQYANPVAGTRSVQVDSVNAAPAEAAAAAQNVVFVNGQASVAGKYKDVGQIRILVKDDATIDAEQLPNGIQGATQLFVVRPYDFVLSDIRDGSGSIVNPQAVDAAGAVFVSAGSPFRATVTARDAEGDPTLNYGRELIAETVRLAVQMHDPLGGANPAVGATVGFAAFNSGRSTGTDFSWQEVGIMQMIPGVGDSDYLGAGDVTGPPSELVGRFVPSHFTVALNTPMLQTACAAGGFTYQGQTFGYSTVPVATATARSASGGVTQNYTGAFFKLAAATLQNRNYTSAAGSLTLSGLPPAADDPVVAEAAPGTATLTFDSGMGLRFTKGVIEGPFAADIELSIDVLDADGVAAAGSAPLGNPVTFGDAGGITFDNGADIRYGRIRVATAIGSERVDLPVRTVAEYYASGSSGFLTNGDDTCTDGVELSLSGFTKDLTFDDTCVLDTGAPGGSGAGCATPADPVLRFREPPVFPNGGDFNVRLAAPGEGNSGSVAINALVPEWLRYDWDTAAGGEENPSGQATFGIFGGEARQIYLREIY